MNEPIFPPLFKTVMIVQELLNSTEISLQGIVGIGNTELGIFPITKKVRQIGHEATVSRA